MFGPELFSCRKGRIAFHTDRELAGKGVLDVEKISRADHSLVGLKDVPVLFGEGDFSNNCRRVLENRDETDTLDSFVDFDTGKFKDGGADIDAADQ